MEAVTPALLARPGRRALMRSCGWRWAGLQPARVVLRAGARRSRMDPRCRWGELATRIQYLEGPGGWRLAGGSEMPTKDRRALMLPGGVADRPGLLARRSRTRAGLLLRRRRRSKASPFDFANAVFDC